MGTYVFGVTNIKRNVGGLDEPVYQMKFICKDSFSGWKEVKRLRARYDTKDSMKGKLVAFDIGTKQAEEVINIYRYKGERNSFTDGDGLEKYLEQVAVAIKTGGRRYFVRAEAK